MPAQAFEYCLTECEVRSLERQSKHNMRYCLMFYILFVYWQFMCVCVCNRMNCVCCCFFFLLLYFALATKLPNWNIFVTKTFIFRVQSTNEEKKGKRKKRSGTFILSFFTIELKVPEWLERQEAIEYEFGVMEFQIKWIVSRMNNVEEEQQQQTRSTSLNRVVIASELREIFTNHYNWSEN